MDHFKIISQSNYGILSDQPHRKNLSICLCSIRCSLLRQFRGFRGKKTPMAGDVCRICYIPEHTKVYLQNAGHFIQEDAPDEIIEAIRKWMKKTPLWISFLRFQSKSTHWMYGALSALRYLHRTAPWAFCRVSCALGLKIENRRWQRIAAIAREQTLEYNGGAQAVFSFEY